MTQLEKDALRDYIISYAIANSQGINDLPDATNLSEISSFPVIQEDNGNFIAKKAAISLLQPKLRSTAGYIQYQDLQTLEWVNIITAEEIASHLELSGYVNATVDQTIDGIKTFNSSPIVPNPTTSQQVTNKNYVDLGLSLKVDSLGTNSNINVLHFNPSTLTQLSNIGDVRYSQESKTLEVKVSDTVSIQLGQEMQTRVKNDAGIQINNGQMVYISSALGANPLAKIATTTDADISQRTYGMATENISTNGFGAITTEGLVRDINTSMFPEGAMLWLGVNGSVTNIEPIAPTPKINVGMVLRSNIANGIIYVKIRAIARNQKLSDVYAPTLTNGDILKWNGSSQRFETYNIATIITDLQNQINTLSNRIETLESL